MTTPNHEQFESNVQKWVQVDNKIKTLNDTLKELRDEKNRMLNDMIEYAVPDNIGQSMTVNISDGQLKFVTSREQQPLTYKYLQTCLSEIIKNESQVDSIITYIKNKRDVVVKREIKRIYT